MSRFGADQEVTCVKESGMELITHCEGMLFDAAFLNPNYMFNLYEGRYGWMCPGDNYNWEKLDKKYLSMWFEDLTCVKLTGTSSSVLIEDINVEEFLEKQEMVRQEKVRLNKEKVWNEKVAKLDLVEKVIERLGKDAEFEKTFNRLRSYFGDRADDAYYYEPEEIISLCQRKDCEKIAITLHDTFKAKKPEIADILDDLANDLDTMTASYLRNFLKRHGYSSYELNKKNVEEMKKDAKMVQLNLIKMLDRDSANTLLDAGDYNLPEGFDNRARFFSSQFPAIPTYRVVHWKFDAEKDCYLVKRVTGATHALYSKFEVVRLTEEDLYEIAELPLHNPSKNEDARQFARFLKIQKRENFDAINFDNPASIRNEALRFLNAEGREVREIMRDQYLCLKFEHVPRKSNHNLLDNLTRWYLEERTFEVVVERKGEKPITFYHPAELNMFTRDDLIKLSKTPPVGKRIWNAYILEFLQEVIKNLIACMPDEQEIEKMKKTGEKKEKKRKAEAAKRRSRRGAQQEKNIQIMD